ncbi:unnamed protein product [Cuscuta campestris]|uniref:Secreted protein n=1 Tax=Cuscuta campestris TaxID=132261 RepID=A0A484NG61_9ASTE|nr:unnamed protein product [Cuscuta campestris]
MKSLGAALMTTKAWLIILSASSSPAIPFTISMYFWNMVTCCDIGITLDAMVVNSSNPDPAEAKLTPVRSSSSGREAGQGLANAGVHGDDDDDGSSSHGNYCVEAGHVFERAHSLTQVRPCILLPDWLTTQQQ